MASEPPFAAVVTEALGRRGLTLRGLCREAAVDPSFLSKVLAGKRNPPSEEDVLRRLAGALELDPVELIVAAGRIPSDWRRLWEEPQLLREVHLRATGAGLRRHSAASLPLTAASPVLLSEELL